MRDNDGRKLDHKTLEQVRIRVVRQVERGARPEYLASVLGFARSTVFGWIARYREGGMDVLKARTIPGRPQKLSGPQLRQIYTLIVGNDPRQLSFEFALWTREMVRELIRREFNIKLSVVSVGRLLRKLGLSPQRPLWRAYQQNLVAVERWKSEVYPAIRTEAATVGATIYFGDEAGVRTDFHAGTTWAPVGQTPVVRTTGTRDSINLISALSAQGALRFSTYAGMFESATFINFCKRLMHDTSGSVFLIVDGHPVHRSKAVKDFVASTHGRLRLFQFPAYSPEINPDEWVWKNVKADRIGRAGIDQAKGNLRSKAVAAMRRLQKLPCLIRGFFADPNLRYIAA
jgi:transposase